MLLGSFRATVSRRLNLCKGMPAAANGLETRDQNYPFMREGRPAGRKGNMDGKISAKTALQIVVAVLAATPVLVGIEGILFGPAFLHVAAPWPVDLDSHFRFLSGFFLAVGIAWYSCIPGIEAKTERFRLLAACTFTGGLARLVSLFLVGAPSLGHVAGLCVELLAVPALVVWQGRVANKAAGRGQLSGA
ncbi:DUF4345 domain-containing protein [Mesorhizobium sp. B2-3-12]|uniref:DUF4345 domain-containing protein n=1 Tax=Mesorhizobium sp. B2-3-12 TaxID=2589952 RepID=UPI001FEFE0B3|nr:DUF4345 domain-containing protein [Mesorhizobium sp. B2-3-12]